MSDKAPAANRTNTRARILDAAETIAHRDGPAAMSLDAVAAAAGVSKGGLLYHFPNKAKLFESMVDAYLARFDSVLHDAEESGKPNAVIRAYIQHFIDDFKKNTRPPSGLLVVLGEQPEMLAPVKRHERNFLARIRANASDPDLATAAFLNIHALRSQALLNICAMDDAEIKHMVEWLLGRLP